MEQIQELDREEVLRYLGYRGTELPPHTERLIEEGMRETETLAHPAYVYRRYPIRQSSEREGILVGETGVCMTGEDIRRHLEGCEEVYLVCATVGTLLDRQIRLKMVTDPAAGVVLDSCGSVAAEQVIEAAEQEIEREVTAEGKQITWRFSPGYGDLPLELQRDLVDVLDLHRRLGVSVSEDMLLAPSKSVTAIIGVLDAAVLEGDAQDVAVADTELENDGRIVAGENVYSRTGNKCERCKNRERCNFYSKGKSCGGV